MHTNKSFILRNIYGQNILMPIKSNNASNDPILLNDVAAFIWKEAATETTMDSTLQNVSDSYKLGPGSPEIMAVKMFIEQLHTMGLLVD